MLHPSQHEPNGHEKKKDESEEAPFMRMFGNLMEYGIGLFEPDGTVNGIGLELLELLLEHFEQRESYGRCAYIKRVMDEYKKRWPYRQANFSLN